VEQKNELVAELREVVGKLVAVTFEDPKIDEQNIRYHAALTGKMQILNMLLQDDFVDPDQPTNHENSEN
jgi:hypothetical protein